MSSDTPLPSQEAMDCLGPRPDYRKLGQRSTWFLELIEAGIVWPETCVAWPWADGIRRHTMYFKGSAVPVTHVVLHFHSGERPSRKHQALHSCDIQWCINPRHLRWGLELENRLDQAARQRGDIGKIGLETARIARLELEEISSRLGVPMDALARIASGKSWAEENWTEETNQDAP